MKEYSAAYINDVGAVVPMTLFGFGHDLAKLQEVVRHLNNSQNSGKNWIVAERDIPEWVPVPEITEISDGDVEV